jgi:hypothetical protein
MAFLFLIIEPRGQRTDRSPEEARRLYDEMSDYGQDLKDRGLLLASESLRPDEHAVRLATPAGSTRAQTQLRDGPFTEAKEMVGGFFLVDVATRDEAVAIARRCPAVGWATVEVRECAPCYVG